MVANCFFCRKEFPDLTQAHLHAFALTSDVKPACSKMELEIIIDMDRNDRWFSK